MYVQYMNVGPMFVYVCTCMYFRVCSICMYAYVAYVRVAYVRMCMCVCMYSMYLCRPMYVCTCVRMYVCTCVYVC